MSDSTDKRDSEGQVQMPRLELHGREYVVFSAPVPSLDDYARITESERDICQQILDGATDAQIADCRGTSTNTVSNQVRAILAKLDVGSRSELVARLVDDAVNDPTA
ncbi:MAG: helix-turn-helix domain-containing protein [Myxococcota bacterium]